MAHVAENAHKIRRRTRTIVAFGDCATTGNVPAMRNQLGLGNAENVLQRAYIECAENNPLVPREPGIVPALLERVMPVIADYRKALEGKRAAPPSLDAGQCRVGAWLNAERPSEHGALPAIQDIETLHRELHDLAAEIYFAQNGSRNAEGPQRLRQLRHLQERCLKKIETFARIRAGKHENGALHSHNA